jgi:hypothetical protein
MTPKEKAQELFDKYNLSFAGVISNEEDWEALAKQCAVIAVDEMLSNDGFSSSLEEWNTFKSHFEQVKKEIEKL